MTRTFNSKRAGGFTLVELLVVIGIIAVLVGILIPTVNGVRKAARKADTKNLITQLTAAIESYHSQFSTYPGVWSNRQLISGVASPTNLDNLLISGGIDSSRNLVLSLSGGLDMNASGTPVTYSFNRQYVGRGPVSLNPLKPGAMGAFMTVNDSDIFYTAANTLPYYADKYVSNPQPILYVRANRGVSTVSNREVGAADYSSGDAPFVYDTQLFKLNGQQLTPEAYFASGWASYLRNPTSPTLMVNRDSYVLISAGEDGIYGTRDDVTNYGTPGGD